MIGFFALLPSCGPNLCPRHTSFLYPQSIKLKSGLGCSSCNDHLGQLIHDSLSWQPATTDFLSTDIAATPLAKVLEAAWQSRSPSDQLDAIDSVTA